MGCRAFAHLLVLQIQLDDGHDFVQVSELELQLVSVFVEGQHGPICLEKAARHVVNKPFVPMSCGRLAWSKAMLGPAVADASNHEFNLSVERARLSHHVLELSWLVVHPHRVWAVLFKLKH